MANKKLSRQKRNQINKNKQIEKKVKRTKNIRAFIDHIGLRKYSDVSINLAVFVLILFGTFMIISTNVGQTTQNSAVVFTTLVKQCAFFVAAYFCMWSANRLFSFRLFSSFEILFILGMAFFMMLPFAFASQGGSQAWIRLPLGITIQPSEFAKPLIIVLVANSIYKTRKYKSLTRDAQTLYKRPFLGLILVTIFLFLQRDLGTLAIIWMIFFACILIPDYKGIRLFQRNLKKVFTLGVVLVILLFGVTNIGIKVIEASPFPHVATRIENAKNPYNDIYGEGYQPANSLYGIASSNVVGKGVGGSARKYGYLTQADNDYILAVTIEETGIFGLSLIVFLYAVIIYKLFFYAFKTNETIYKIVLVGTSTYLFMHFFLNVGGVAALIPFTGVPLLFISSGGSSLMAICIAIGLCQQCISQIRIHELGE